MLPNNDEYYYTQKQIFHSEIDSIHAFVKRNYSIGMHVQQFPEINIVTKGCGKHYIEENCIDVKVGDIFIIPAEVRHGYLGGEDFDVFHVLIHQRFIDKNSTDFQALEAYYDLFRVEPIMRAKSTKPLHLRLVDREFKEVLSLLHKMAEYKDYYLPSDCIALNGLAMVLISMLCKAYSNLGNKNEASTYTPDKSFMKAIAKIHESYGEKLTVTELAKTANLSKSAFVKRFKQVCKVPPSEYLLKRRIEAVEYKLANTALSIGEIAAQTGFYDASHLNKSFIAENGVTAAAYRKKHGKN